MAIKKGAPNKSVKSYAVNIIHEIREDVRKVNRESLPALDLGDVISVTKANGVLIEPHGHDVVYDEDDLVWQIDPDTLKKGDVIVLGRDSSEQPIVLGKADGNNEDPFDDPDVAALRDSFVELQEESQGWRAAVGDLDELPEDSTGNRDGDLRFVQSEAAIYAWNANTETWVIVTGGGSAPSTVLIPTALIDFTDSPFLLGPNDQAILVDSTLGPVTVTLPDNHINGKLYEIKDRFGTATINNITVVSNDGDLIEGNLTLTLNVNFQSFVIVSDGSNWFIV